MPRSSAIRDYRKRVKTSKCRGLGSRLCSRNPSCKYANGKIRSFCRKTKNSTRSSKRSSRRSSRSSSKSLSFKSVGSSGSLSFKSAKSK